MIDANHGPIHLLQAAFYAVKLEVRRRGLVIVVPESYVSQENVVPAAVLLQRSAVRHG